MDDLTALGLGPDDATDASSSDDRRDERDEPDERDARDRPRGRRGRRRPRSRAARTLLAVGAALVLMLVAAGVAAGGFALHLASSWDDSTTTLDDAFPADAGRPAPAADGSVNLLLLGSDSRGDATTLDDGSPSDQRTDTMMLLHVDADRQHASVMSVMRDLWVPIPGRGDGKVNSAFAHGGSPLAVQTVEALLGARVDHVAIIDFEGFADMTTALGGVDVVSEKAFRSAAPDRGAPYDYVQGVNHLEGDAALAFVRERAAFADADFQRVENQQAFLEGVLGTLVSRDTLTDPTRVTGFLTATAPHVTVDAGLDAASLVSLGASLRSVRPGDVDFFTVPTAGTGTSHDGQSIVLPDDAGISDLRDALRDDRVRAFLDAHEGRP
ncbi:LytR family transcriptional regulator [Frigoribacterium sp. ACAM 257]|uniref:LCP family protein n=1 Tax=Frigoribacterium sp. ACAM 257 TaxID=2508998 RepID=UPI0011B969CF|nr:LCP family protein [Frigoribacterium sp. ACAM 257]TWX35016.1 LytR family transcriptional regulator [Frigoribacterium sp. ACAM 257]